MRRLLILTVLLLAAIFANAQDQDTVGIKLNKLAHPDYEIAPRVDNVPLDKYLSAKIPVPDGLTTQSRNYAVAVIHVDSTGIVSDARLLKSYSPVTDKSILQALNSLPQLKPAYYKGHNSGVDLAMVIRFGQAVYNDPAIKTICILHPPSTAGNNDQVFVAVQQEPSFHGGSSAFKAFLKQNLVYPEKAKAQHIEGKVFVSFVVRKDGSLDNITIVRSPDDELSKEALRLMHICPPFDPGMQNGKAVNCQFMMPIMFDLD